MKKAFTLAEIMIALVVIGVITSIILPVAFNNVPNENIMKFKKGNATLAKVINELVTSDKYYKDGDLGVKADGSYVDDATFLCETMADVLNTKSVNCSDLKLNKEFSIINLDSEHRKDDKYMDLETNKIVLDYICNEFSKQSGAQIVLPDGIVFYDLNPAYHFASCYDDDLTTCNPEGTMFHQEEYDYDEAGNITTKISNILRVYKIFCMDIDGINQGEEPFGYGIRADGKILLGKKAQEWVEKSLQDKE